MEVFLIMINIVLFSSDNVVIENRKEVENNQIYYMLMLHRLVTQFFFSFSQLVPTIAQLDKS